MSRLMSARMQLPFHRPWTHPLVLNTICPWTSLCYLHHPGTPGESSINHMQKKTHAEIFGTLLTWIHPCLVGKKMGISSRFQRITRPVLNTTSDADPDRGTLCPSQGSHRILGVYVEMWENKLENLSEMIFKSWYVWIWEYKFEPSLFLKWLVKCWG